MSFSGNPIQSEDFIYKDTTIKNIPEEKLL